MVTLRAQQSGTRARLRLPLCNVAAVLAALACVVPAQAATYVVNSSADAVDAAPGNGACATAAGQCTLRAAVQEANASAGADVITLPAGTYRLTIPGANENAALSGDLDVSDDLTIDGGDPMAPADTVIDGGGAAGTLQDRLFDIVGAAAGRSIVVRLNGVTLQGGYQQSDPNGGGAVCNHCGNSNVNSPNEVPTLHLMSVIVRDNFSDSAGGAVSNHATLMIDDSLIADNYTPFGSPATGITGMGGGMGGGVMNWGGTVSISRSTFSGNYAQSGGAIYNQDAFVSGVVLLTDVTVRDNNAAFGGGIYNLAIGDFNFPGRVAGQVGLTANRVTLSGNYAQIDGGGLYNQGIGTVMMVNSTVSMNQTGGRAVIGSYPNRGGGIYNGGRLLDLLNVTVAANESAAPRVSGATADASRGGDELFLNTANAGGTPGSSIPMVFHLQNTVVGDGVASGDNCNGATGYTQQIDVTNSLESGTSCGFAAPSISAADPLLSPLANNGGPTQTMAPFTGSPVLNRGSNCPVTDQRGAPRDTQCDLGAVELSVAVPPTPSPGPTPTPPPPITPPANTAPVARNLAITVQAGATVTGNLVAVDNERDALTYRIATPAGRGTATLTSTASGAFSYTASNAGAGTDSFTFIASDGRLDSNIATVTVTISATPVVNAPPLAANGSLAVAPGATATGTLVASDSNGDPLTFRTVGSPSQGTVTVTNAATGAYSYTANANATGSDSFSFVANDGRADSNVGVVTVTFSVANTPPAAGDGTLSVAAGATAAGRLVGSDPDRGDRLTFAVVGSALKGTLTLTDPSSGAYSYAAAANASGTDTFTFKVSDGKADSGIATVTITIANANAPPSAGDGTLGGVAAGSTVTGQLLVTDQDGDPLTFTLVQRPNQGTVTITDPRTATYQYVANANAVGSDTFTFSVSDGRASSQATVTITFGGAGAPAVAGRALQVRDVRLQVPVTGFVSGQLPSSSAGGAVTFNVVRPVALGQLNVNRSTGAFTYLANAGASGVDTFTFNITDGAATSNTAVVLLALSSATGAVPGNPSSGSANPPAGDSGGGTLDTSMFVLLLSALGVRRARRLSA